MEYEATQAIEIPVLDYLEMELHLMEARPGVRPETLVRELVKRWLATETEQSTSHTGIPEVRGFQWKELFLPDKTMLRTSHGDNVEFAVVDGDRIVSKDGVTLTPSLFANRHGKGRNAWRFVWLRFPENDGWSRADDCRGRRQAQPPNQSTSCVRSKTVQTPGATGLKVPPYPPVQAISI